MMFGRTTRCQDEVAVGRREAFILDRARDLLLSRGYNRVTVEDIANQARIGKGTIYLHWDSKSELVAAILHREALDVNRIQTIALRTRPETVMLPQLAKLNYSVILRRPLYRAFYTRDDRLLGRFLDDDSPVLQGYRARLGRCYVNYFAVLAEERLVPTDVECRLAMTVMESLCLGLVIQSEQFVDEAPIGQPSQPEDVLGQTLQRAFGPPVPPTEAAVRRAACRTAVLFEEIQTGTTGCRPDIAPPRPYRASARARAS